MGQLTIQELDDALLVQLKRQAWECGLPLQEYVRQLLKSGVQAERTPSRSRSVWIARPPWIVESAASNATAV